MFFFFTCTLQKKICNWDLHPGVTELIIKKKKKAAGKPGLHSNRQGKSTDRHYTGKQKAASLRRDAQVRTRTGLRSPSGSSFTPAASVHMRRQSLAISVYLQGVRKPKQVYGILLMRLGWFFCCCWFLGLGFVFFFSLLTGISLPKLLWSEASNPLHPESICQTSPFRPPAWLGPSRALPISPPTPSSAQQ